MRIYAIRHGLTGLNKRGVLNGEIDEPLAPEGKEQARQAAKKLPGSIRHIYASSQKRALQTAELLALPLALPVNRHPSLVEIRLGSLRGHAWEDLPDGARLKDLHRTVRFDYTAFGGESVQAVITRLTNFIRSIEHAHADDEVLLVTHGGIMRVLHFLESGEAVYDTRENLSLLPLDTAKILGRQAG
ncbi:MAG TPA: histidine phosphatase family protein [Candidatus Saccharimonadales bacterium]|nr:histidine phosphatase family protein [Candidatus Saccharimonadales bacterium]